MRSWKRSRGTWELPPGRRRHGSPRPSPSRRTPGHDAGEEGGDARPGRRLRRRRRLRHAPGPVPEPRHGEPAHRRRPPGRARAARPPHGAAVAGGGGGRRRRGRPGPSTGPVTSDAHGPRPGGGAAGRVPRPRRQPRPLTGRLDHRHPDDRDRCRRAGHGRPERGEPAGGLRLPDDHGDRDAHPSRHGRGPGAVRAVHRCRPSSPAAPGGGTGPGGGRLRHRRRPRRTGRPPAAVLGRRGAAGGGGPVRDQRARSAGRATDRGRPGLRASRAGGT